MLVFNSPLNRQKIDEVAATADEVSQDYIDVTFESAFEERVRFYLVQAGHPEDEQVKARRLTSPCTSLLADNSRLRLGADGF